MRRRTALALLAVGLGVAGAASALWVLDERGIAPRTLAPYIDKRSSGHNALISGAGDWMAGALIRLDRGTAQPTVLPALSLGAQPQAVASAPGGATRPVASVDALRAAMASASPGDVIELAPGVYQLRRKALQARVAGTAEQPIVVRAALPGSAVLEVVAIVGVEVAAPWWRFENLTLRGACGRHSDCEHAFHVVGGAHHFAALNNTLVDFNAHFKVNGLGGLYPDHGRIEGNTLRNTAPRATRKPVTPIDIVAASDWTMRGNLIADFVKRGGDGVSYGAFAKGAALRTVFERNVVLCEDRLRGEPGQRVGLSFGGGGSGARYCRDGRCITEHEDGILRDNLIASCSDVGIYLNSAARTRIDHNTLLDTAGIQVRYPTSGADLEGNLVDGAIRSRDGGRLRGDDNLATPIVRLYAGMHPQRDLFVDSSAFDLRWRADAPRREGSGAGADLCGVQRGKQPAYGAFDDFAACLRRAK